MISYNKMSKRAKHEFNAARRVTWDFCPVSRVKPSKKAYSRKRMQNDE